MQFRSICDIGKKTQVGKSIKFDSDWYDLTTCLDIDTEGETEQKESNGKEKARRRIKNSFWEPTILNQED